MLTPTHPVIDPLTIDCDLIVDGERVRWTGATALYREIEAKRDDREHPQEKRRNA